MYEDNSSLKFSQFSKMNQGNFEMMGDGSRKKSKNDSDKVGFTYQESLD